MLLPVNFIDNLEKQLPPVNEYKGYCFYKDFIYEGKNGQIKFYKVTENGTIFFWLRDYYCQTVWKDGSYEAVK